jgi:hypothetical protein
MVTRWVMTLIALVVLVAIAYKGYFWFMGNAARHQAQAADQESNQVTVPPPVEVPGLAQSDDAQDAAPGKVSAIGADLGNINDPDQRRAVCGYLAAESERLGHDFKQPLPPPVIDRIATETAQLRAQISRYGCTPADPQDATDVLPPPDAAPVADD